MRTLLIIMALALMVALCHMSALAGPIDDIASWQKGLASATASFKQEKKNVLLGKTMRSKGSVSYSPDAGVRWVYEGQMVVIYDGDKLYMHHTELGEADVIEDAGGFIGPLAFDVERLKSGYDMLAVPFEGGVTLTLTPRKRMPFERMVMRFANGSAFPSDVTMHESTGDSTTIRFEGVRLNQPLDPSLFKFTPPKGVKLRHRKSIDGGK